MNDEIAFDRAVCGVADRLDGPSTGCKAGRGDEGLPLEPIRGIHIESSDVYYSLDVTRYVEVTADIPVTADNVPADKKIMLFPSTVTVRMKCEFPLIEDPEVGLRASVDYKDFSSSLGGNCLVRMSEMPKGVISCELEPLAVRCVEEER